MLVGYARVSADDEKLNLQRDFLNQVGCERLFEDHFNGAKVERPGLQQALNFVRAGDTLVVWRLDRLSRSLKDLIGMMALLETKGIALKSIEDGIDTSTSSGELIFRLFGALAKFERNVIKERNQAGLRAARARGRNGGRPKALSQDKQDLAVKLYDEKNYTVAQICQMMGISKPTLYKYLGAARGGRTE
ncbi:transposon DNA-invertase [Yersinia entomophaga]|uniref:Transposon DNA-invertase n=1 Tax=Yersinia entomophaga TaxID=935293 RepID=A0ABN4Q0R4_YERET|nr:MULTISPECIES: recombinase family protein [Yersinia]ANI31244.1 transposon DNA-invertase [Yersinia entomophaga]OWF90036.1 transposon DNA-invertase [Yersinia entomophaga]